jgi:ribosomal protein S18 acetylase RimI-like enzyme
MLNSLSKVLSTNDHLFASGLSAKGSHGFWGLHVYEAPMPATSAIPKECKPVPVMKRSFKTMQKPMSDSNLLSDSSSECDDQDDETQNAGGRPIPSLELKKQLLERLLMMDSSILTDAIKKAKAKKTPEEEEEKQSKSKQPRPKLAKIEIVDEYPSASIIHRENILPKPVTPQIMAFLKAYHLPITTNPMLIRTGPHENDLLKRCMQSENKSAAVNRLLRKLITRRQKRKAMLPFFDLDHWMYLYLKSSEEPLVLATASASPALAQSFPLTFNPDEIPYMSDPSRSMYVKLTGLGSLYGQIPYPVPSPFTGKLLEPFVLRDYSFSCPKMKLLSEIREFGGIPDDGCGEEEEEEEADSEESLDFVHLRREFVGQCNDLLSLSFWPGIDVTDALEYPDYTMLALYRHAVVACAFLTPDGYLSYLHVRPDFQGHKISEKLLSLLLPIVSPRKDITLHVSVSNASAILLYQRFGFKPEEFIVSFYEKYYPHECEENSKNAFFMRLKR